MDEHQQLGSPRPESGQPARLPGNPFQRMHPLAFAAIVLVVVFFLYQVVAGLAAVAGHNWPVFAKFKGGRGVTAYFSTLFAIYPPVGIFGAQIVAIAALRSRHMSLGSILGASAALCLMIPLTIAYNFPPIYLAYCSVTAALLIYQHLDNIKRLRQGTERRLW